MEVTVKRGHWLVRESLRAKRNALRALTIIFADLASACASASRDTQRKLSSVD